MDADGANIVRVTNHPKSDRLPRVVPTMGGGLPSCRLEGERAGIFTSLTPMGVNARQVTHSSGA